MNTPMSHQAAHYYDPSAVRTIDVYPTGPTLIDITPVAPTTIPNTSPFQPAGLPWDNTVPLLPWNPNPPMQPWDVNPIGVFPVLPENPWEQVILPPPVMPVAPQMTREDLLRKIEELRAGRMPVDQFELMLLMAICHDIAEEKKREETPSRFDREDPV